MSTASRERTTLLAGLVAGVGLLIGIVLLLEYCEPLKRWFTEKSNTGIIISEAGMRDLMDQIRTNYFTKWRQQVDELAKVGGEMRAMRDRHMDTLRQTQGDLYRDEFLKLCANKHKQVEMMNLDDPEAQLADVFTAAVAVEADLMNDYHDILAAKNAIDRRLQALDAINQVKMVHPDRIELKRGALEAKIVQPGDAFELFKKQIKLGNTEMATMLKHAQRVLHKARRGDQKSGAGGVTMITDIGGGSTAGETLNPDQLNVDATGTTEGNFAPVPCHIIGNERGVYNKNVFLNDWYVIGPFENRFRINRDASFMPESVVDLDSKTIGKDGKVIGWEYWRCRKQRIEPSWADNGVIYYGWTEVWMEQGGEYWVAVGSDDKGVLWVNGKKEWESGNERKPYRADEWVAPLKFKEGRNEILFRCENDGGTMGWSVILLVGNVE